MSTPDRFTYDAQCFYLAEYFLPAAEILHKQKLAQTIQDAIEDWLWEREAALAKGESK